MERAAELGLVLVKVLLLVPLALVDALVERRRPECAVMIWDEPDDWA